MPGPEGLVLVDRHVTRTRLGKQESYIQQFWVKPDAVRPGDKVVTDEAEVQRRWLKGEQDRIKDRAKYAENRAKRKEEGVAKKPVDTPPPLPPPPKPDRGQYEHAEKAPEGSFPLPADYSAAKVAKLDVSRATMRRMFLGYADNVTPGQPTMVSQNETEARLTAKWLAKNYPEYAKPSYDWSALSNEDFEKLQDRIFEDLDDKTKAEGIGKERRVGNYAFVSPATRVRHHLSSVWFANNKPLLDALKTAQVKFSPSDPTQQAGRAASRRALASLKAFPEGTYAAYGVMYDNGVLALSAGQADQLRRAFKYGVDPADVDNVEKRNNASGVSTLLHEMLHAASHGDYKYDGSGHDAPFGNLEEATTETLAKGYLGQYARDLGIEVKNAEFFTKPYFTKVPEEKAPGDIPKWEVASRRPSSYPGQVQRFNVVAAYAEDAKTPEEAHAAAQSWAAAIKKTRGTLRYARLADKFVEKALKDRSHPQFKLARNNVVLALKKFMNTPESLSSAPKQTIPEIVGLAVSRALKGYDTHSELSSKQQTVFYGPEQGAERDWYYTHKQPRPK